MPTFAFCCSTFAVTIQNIKNIFNFIFFCNTSMSSTSSKFGIYNSIGVELSKQPVKQKINIDNIIMFKIILKLIFNFLFIITFTTSFIYYKTTLFATAIFIFSSRTAWAWVISANFFIFVYNS